MKGFSTIFIESRDEGFLDITSLLKNELHKMLGSKSRNGILYLFLPHTSCGLIIQEAFDSSAKKDMENYLKHLAPRNLPFITHTAEGPDDSPSHMKTLTTGHSLNLIIDKGQLILGTWQGVYLTEFRDGPQQRKVHLKFIEG
jgi:secondary thiamine-phosphate synthase enzyme